jgi:hypothetical protein
MSSESPDAHAPRQYDSHLSGHLAGLFELNVEALDDPFTSRVLDILQKTNLLTSGMQDAIATLALVRDAEQEMTGGGASTYDPGPIEKLRNLAPEYDEHWSYALGIALSVVANEKYEESHLRRTAVEALDQLLAGNPSGINDSKIMAIVSAIEGDTMDPISLEVAAKLIPQPTVEKVASVRELILKTDIEAFVINTARNIAIVEDEAAPAGPRLRAAVNIIETLSPVLRMFGDGFEAFRIRARDSAGELLAKSDPETFAKIKAVHQLAERAREPVLTRLKALAGGDGQVIGSRIKSDISHLVKSMRKDVPIDHVADPLGYRIESPTQDHMVRLVSNIIATFQKVKHGRIETPEYSLRIGRTDGEEAIELDVANASELWSKVGMPENAVVSGPRPSGYQTVHINFIMKFKDGSDPLNIELQIGTVKMHRKNQQGESVVSIFKLGRDPDTDIVPILTMLDHIQNRARDFIDGKRMLSMNTQLRLVQLMPEWKTPLSELITVMGIDGKLFGISKRLGDSIGVGDMSEELLAEKSAVLVGPMGCVDIDSFTRIVGSIEPNFVAEKSQLRQALTLLQDWHKADRRRDGNSHFEGHILPATLTYLINRAAQGLKVDEDELIAFIAHDGIEDEKKPSRRKRKRNIMRNLFSKKVYDLVDLLTKNPDLNGDAADAEQAMRLMHAESEYRDIVTYMKVIDRFCSHITDMEAALKKEHMEAALKKEHWEQQYSKYFVNTTSYFTDIFMQNEHTRPLWLLCRDTFKAVEGKYSTK